MLWLGLGLLSIGAVAAIVIPLLRGRKGAAPSRGAFDRAIYRDQLAELARDVERGVVDPDHAAASRIEIERRLLATDTTAQVATSMAPPGARLARRARPAFCLTSGRRRGCGHCARPGRHGGGRRDARCQAQGSSR